MKHTIQALVENKFGVLARISSLFSARGYNIDSLAVGVTQDPTISCMTIIVNAEDENILEQIKKQLNKLIDVITVTDLTKKDYIDRELILLNIKISKEHKDKWNEIKPQIKGNILSENDFAVVELIGDSHFVKEELALLKPLNIVELVRTGKIAIVK